MKIHISVRTVLLIAVFIAGTITLSAQDKPTTIGLIGCHVQGKPAPAIPYFAEVIQPDFCLWLGDNVYADTRTDAGHIQRQLDVLAGKDGFQELKQQSKFYVTWDDHDYGLNNAGKNYPLKEESKQIHRKFWELEDEIAADQDGVYYAGIEQLPNGKKIQFIMLDGRFNRDKKGRKADALGEHQWKWLQSELNKEADLRFIVSGYQVLLDKPSRWEAWVKLGKSRDRLFNMIKDSGARGVLFITGDQHTAEILRSKKALGYDGYEIMAAGINQTERPGIAQNRILGPDVTLHSAPYLSIHWESDDRQVPHIHFVLMDVEEHVISSEYRIPFSALGL